MEDKYKNFIQQAQVSRTGTLMEWMEINFVEAGENYLIASMFVDKKFYQPFKILHGGVFSVLAETVASAASFLYVSPEEKEVRGMSIQLNHLVSVKKGELKARAELLHLGNLTHIWDIKIYNEKRLVSVGRQNNIIITKKKRINAEIETC